MNAEASNINLQRQKKVILLRVKKGSVFWVVSGKNVQKNSILTQMLEKTLEFYED